VELAKQMEVEYLVIHCGYHFSLFPDVVFESLVKTFTPVVELAEKYDIPLGIENMNALHPDAEILYLGVTIDELSRVFGAIKSRYLGLTLDVAHANLLPGGVESFIRAFPDKIVSTHISDNHGDIDRHLPVGEGSIDFRKVFKLLMGIGFQGTLNIELKKNEDRLISKQRLEPILRELGVSSYGGLTVIS
jgi:sugar phosphate isomerase/epimerase